MSKINNLGRCTVKTGEYEKDGKMKGKYVTIGQLREMVEDDGSTRMAFEIPLWMLNPVIAGLARTYMKKGSDTVWCSIWADDGDRQSGGSSARSAPAATAPARRAAPPAADDEDEIPF